TLTLHPLPPPPWTNQTMAFPDPPPPPRPDPPTTPLWCHPPARLPLLTKHHVAPLPAPCKDQQKASMPQVGCLALLPSTLLLAPVASLATHSPSNPTSVPAGWMAPHPPPDPPVNECSHYQPTNDPSALPTHPPHPPPHPPAPPQHNPIPLSLPLFSPPPRAALSP